MLQRAIDILSRPETLLLGGGFAAFLVLTWLVRGAPIGQAALPEPEEAPPPARRDRAVALAVFGFLLVVIGAVVAFREGIPWSLPCFAVGIGLVLWVQKANRPYRHVSPTLRRVVAFADTALTASLVGGILLVANVAAFKYGGRPLDFTQDEAFSLSTLSVREVGSLPRPLKFSLVMGQDPKSVRHRARIRQVVRLYKEANPEKVSFEEVDPYRRANAALYDALLKRTPDLAMMPGDAVVVEYGGDEGPVARSVIAVADLTRSAPGPGGGTLTTTFTGEDAITSTIARLREGKRTTIGFVTGHGEPSLNEMDPRIPGLGLWKSRMASFGLDAAELNLTREEVPRPIPLAVLVAPRTPFAEPELARLKAFLGRGGALLIVTDRRAVGLDDVLTTFNIAFEKGTIADARFNLGHPTDIYTPPLPKSDHPLVAALAGQSFVLPAASPLRIIGRGPTRPGESKPNANPAVVDDPLLQTSPSSRSIVNNAEGRLVPDRAADLPGPLLVGAAVSERGEPAAGEGPKPKAVVLSSALMATNPFFPTNSDLLMNAVQWLRGKAEESSGIAPRVQTPLVFNADPNLRVRLHLIPTVLSVVLIVGFGATIHLSRRS